MTKHIDPDVSDLFFTRDFSSMVTDEGEWIMPPLREDAQTFCDSINRLTNQNYSVDDILNDFFDRV